MYNVHIPIIVNLKKDSFYVFIRNKNTNRTRRIIIPHTHNGIVNFTSTNMLTVYAMHTEVKEKQCFLPFFTNCMDSGNLTPYVQLVADLLFYRARCIHIALLYQLHTKSTAILIFNKSHIICDCVPFTIYMLHLKLK